MFLCFFEANPAHRQYRWPQVAAFDGMLKIKLRLPGNALSVHFHLPDSHATRYIIKKLFVLNQQSIES